MAHHWVHSFFKSTYISCVFKKGPIKVLIKTWTNFELYCFNRNRQNRWFTLTLRGQMGNGMLTLKSMIEVHIFVLNPKTFTDLWVNDYGSDTYNLFSTTMRIVTQFMSFFSFNDTTSSDHRFLVQRKQPKDISTVQLLWVELRKRQS